MTADASVLHGIRRLLLLTLVGGMFGTAAELWLLEHYEDPWQYAPLILLAAGLLSVVWHAFAPGAAALRTLHAVMLVFILSGAVGVGLHVQGNREFELEMTPTRRGADLAWRTLSGATPVLAPGSMTLLGLVGLAHIYRLKE